MVIYNKNVLFKIIFFASYQSNFIYRVEAMSKMFFVLLGTCRTCQPLNILYFCVCKSLLCPVTCYCHDQVCFPVKPFVIVVPASRTARHMRQLLLWCKQLFVVPASRTARHAVTIAVMQAAVSSIQAGLTNEIKMY